MQGLWSEAREATAVVCDVTDAASVQQAFEAVGAGPGGLDIVVAHAGCVGEQASLAGRVISVDDGNVAAMPG